MAKISSWIKASRPRTLPLATASILMGSFLAIYYGSYKWPVIVLALLTTILLQILSNLANDYGDAAKGTDNASRLGPVRTVQGGEISPQMMKKGIVVVSVLAFLSGLLMLWIAFPGNWPVIFIFIVLGLLAILAAIKYTVGKGAYGYAGFGDLFVFLFFGITGVAGSFYLNAGYLNLDVIYPAITLGLFSVGVLNLNNMRDADNDRTSGKNTLASRLGIKGSKAYHALLILGGIIASVIFAERNATHFLNWLFLLTVPLLLRDLVSVIQQKEAALLDPYLKRLALGTFLFTIVFGIGFLL